MLVTERQYQARSAVGQVRRTEAGEKPMARRWEAGLAVVASRWEEGETVLPAS